MKNQFDSEPEKKWIRKNYDESVFKNLHLRGRAEIETGRDMDKSIEQLVCDVHEEILNTEKSPNQQIAGALQRMVAMMARIAISNEQTQISILRLNRFIVFIALISLLISLLSGNIKIC